MHDKPTIYVKDVTKDPAFPEYLWKIRLPRSLRGKRMTVFVFKSDQYPARCHSRDAAYSVAYNFIMSDDWELRKV